MNDPISDMLARIRNASRALLPSVELPHSRMKENLAGILRKEGYIAEYSVEGKFPKTIRLKLKYQGKKCVIEGLQRIDGYVLRENSEMLKMCRELGFVASFEAGAADVVNVSLNLDAASQNNEGETSLTATAASD